MACRSVDIRRYQSTLVRLEVSTPDFFDPSAAGRLEVSWCKTAGNSKWQDLQ
jgi:hypothetical protein